MNDGLDDPDAEREKIKTIDKLLNIKLDHLVQLRKITNEAPGLVKTAEQDVNSMEASILKLVAELILLKKRLLHDGQTGALKILPADVLNVPSTLTWLMAIGIKETSRKLETKDIQNMSVENFLDALESFMSTSVSFSWH